MKTKYLIVAGLLIVAIGAVSYSRFQESTGESDQPVVVSTDDQETDPIVYPTSETVSVTGEGVCLEAKPGETTTFECRYAVKTAEGSIYSLDLSRVTMLAETQVLGEELVLTGMLVPIEAISTDMYQPYQLDGVLSVETFEIASE